MKYSFLKYALYSFNIFLYFITLYIINETICCRWISYIFQIFMLIYLGIIIDLNVQRQDQNIYFRMYYMLHGMLNDRGLCLDVRDDILERKHEDF